MDRKPQKALISLYFCAVLTHGRRRTSVNLGFIFANLCKILLTRGLVHFILTKFFFQQGFSLTTAMHFLTHEQMKRWRTYARHLKKMNCYLRFFFFSNNAPPAQATVITTADVPPISPAQPDFFSASLLSFDVLESIG